MSRRPAGGRGFTVLEFLTACAALVVVMGLMTSLARYVRSNAAQATMREQLLFLNAKLAAAGPVPGMPAFAPGVSAEQERLVPSAVRQLALQNAELWADHLGVDRRSFLDSWGTPIVLIEGPHPVFGSGLRSQPFFLSAGPDCLFFTLGDDLYGYELQPMAVTINENSAPTTHPKGGQGE